MGVSRYTLKKLYRAGCAVEAAVAAVFLLLTVMIIFALAIFRTFSIPLHWALDIALLVFAWGVFLGADVAFREDKLVNVDFVLVKLPDRLQRAVQLFLYLLIGVFLAALVYYGVDLSIWTRHRSFQGIPLLSYTWVTVSIPVCSFLMLVTLSLKIRGTLVPRRSDAAEEVKPEL